MRLFSFFKKKDVQVPISSYENNPLIKKWKNDVEKVYAANYALASRLTIIQSEASKFRENATHLKENCHYFLKHEEKIDDDVMVNINSYLTVLVNDSEDVNFDDLLTLIAHLKEELMIIKESSIHFKQEFLEEKSEMFIDEINTFEKKMLHIINEIKDAYFSGTKIVKVKKMFAKLHCYLREKKVVDNKELRNLVQDGFHFGRSVAHQEKKMLEEIKDFNDVLKKINSFCKNEFQVFRITKENKILLKQVA